MKNEVEVEIPGLFNTSIHGILGDSVKIQKMVPLDNYATKAFDELLDLEPYKDDHKSKYYVPNADFKYASGKPFVNQSQLLPDTLINAEVLLPNEDS